MKQKLLFLAAICLFSAKSFATVYTVMTGTGGSAMSFSPASVTMQVGDTIKWKWAAGSHTTTSMSIPVGAATWDHPIASANDSFMYKATVAGSYTYKCTPHFSMGMTGAFTVQDPSDVATVASKRMFYMYPNPARELVHLELSGTGAEVTITDLLGRVVKKMQCSGSNAEVRLDGIQNGTYILRATSGNSSYAEQLLIMH